jgi:hypothetical protein
VHFLLRCDKIVNIVNRNVHVYRGPDRRSGIRARLATAMSAWRFADAGHEEPGSTDWSIARI